MRMWRKGETVFYDIYTAKEKKADPQKKNTGLIFFKGKPGRQFAVVNAGGGWSYVGTMHESFPAAMELSKKGYRIKETGDSYRISCLRWSGAWIWSGDWHCC